MNNNRMCSYSMSEIFPIIQELINIDKQVVITARGNSMRPFLRDRIDRLILAKPCDAVQKGDVMLYEKPDGVFVLHRVVSKDEDGTFTFMGDCQNNKDVGVTADMIKAKLVGFFRGSKEISTDNPRYKKFVNIWMKSRFVRRIYVGIFHRIKTR